MHQCCPHLLSIYCPLRFAGVGPVVLNRFGVGLVRIAVFWLIFALPAGCTPDGTGGSQPVASPSSGEVSVPPEENSDSKFRFQSRDGFTLPFSFQNGEDADYYAILEALGGGVACLDFDGDGNWDVFLPGGGVLHPKNVMTAESSGLFRNLPQKGFQDYSEYLPVPLAFTHGAAAADFDNDGFPDVAVTGYGGLQLLHNNGDGTFTDVTLYTKLNDSSWSTNAAWGDLNSDGYLDLYVVHYLDWSFENNPECVDRLENRRDTCPPRTFQSLTDEVFLNSAEGTFLASRESLGFSIGGNGLGVLIADLDGDRDVDVYVANDGVPNFVYQNTDGKFADTSVTSGADRNDRGLPDGSMGLEIGDFNGDLLPDVWVTNYENEATALYRSCSEGFFQHASQPMGLAAVESIYVGWGICLSDFDTDGDEDVFIATGHAIRHSASAPRLQKPLLLKNDNGRQFVNVAQELDGYFEKGHLGRGVSGCDLDNDGRCDLIISQMHEPVTVQWNSTEPAMDWVGLHLIGRKSPRHPIGATAILNCDGNQQLRIVKGGSSYMSTSDPRVLFAVPLKTQSVSVEINWPSGITRKIADLSRNRYHRIVE
jgi:enediyne biosynthesis protein E4